MTQNDAKQGCTLSLRKSNNASKCNHSPQFYLDEGSLPVGLRVMMGVAVDYLQDTKR